MPSEFALHLLKTNKWATFGCQNFLESVAARVGVCTCTPHARSGGHLFWDRWAPADLQSPRQSLVQRWHIWGNNSLLCNDAKSESSDFEFFQKPVPISIIFLWLFMGADMRNFSAFKFGVSWRIKNWYFSPFSYFAASLWIHFYSTSPWLCVLCRVLL